MLLDQCGEAAQERATLGFKVEALVNNTLKKKKNCQHINAVREMVESEDHTGIVDFKNITS